MSGLDMMPGQIPDPALAAGSLPCLGLAGISATTLTDQLKLADFHQLGTMLSPLHFLGRLGKRHLAIKTEVSRRKRGRRESRNESDFERTLLVWFRVLKNEIIVANICQYGTKKIISISDSVL